MSLQARMSGSRTKASIDPDRLLSLNRGVAESQNHIEEMAMDWPILLGYAYPDHGFDTAAISKAPFIRRFRLLGELLRTRYGATLLSEEFTWISDTVRGWLAMAVGGDPGLSIGQKMESLLPYARDHHFAVREWAWLALRPDIVSEPLQAFETIQELARSANHFDRRFAVEALRPRSVWGSHIEAFKASPELAEDFLATLRCDDHIYVRLSLGNWLNDAASTRPDWVRSTVDGWLSSCSCKYTEHIVRRATRRISRPI